VIRLVYSELLKLRTTRTFWGLTGATLGLVVLVTVLTLALDSKLHSENDVRSLLSSAEGGGILMLVLGVVFSAGEYRHGTIASTLLVTPNRLRAVAAKTIACAAAGLAVGLAIAAITAAIGLPWLSAGSVPTLSTGELLGLFLGGVLYTALACSLGAGVGALLRNQVAAVVLVLVLLFVVDPAVSAVAEGYAKYSLGGLGTALSGGPAENVAGGNLLPFWLAALLWTAYTTVLVAVAAVLVSRRDV
jgi:ABC-2 type transport system permease protein